MKAGNCCLGWRSWTGAGVIGALVLGVSVYAAPRTTDDAATRQKAEAKADPSRLIAGPGAHLNEVLAGTGADPARITLQPRTAKVGPAYPAGTTIVGTTLNAVGGGFRAWFEVKLANWDADGDTAPSGCQTTAGFTDRCLKVWQAKIDGICGYDGGDVDTKAIELACDPDGNAGDDICSGGPGGADLKPADQSCTSDADCTTTMGSPGGAGECGQQDAGKCPAGYQDTSRSDWVFTPLPGSSQVASVDLSSLNFRFGGSTVPPAFKVDTGLEFYGGDLVIDIPAGAKGMYCINWLPAETFMFDQTQPAVGSEFVVLETGACVNVVCGKCCTNLGAPGAGCQDGHTAASCASAGGTTVFTPNDTCDNPPGPDGCAECVVNADCNDNDACTSDACSGAPLFLCSNTPVASWNQLSECCNALDGSEDPLVSPDQCVNVACSLPGNRGDIVYSLSTGACNDNNPCKFDDTCTGGSLGANPPATLVPPACVGTDVSSVACTCTGGGASCGPGESNCLADTGIDQGCEGGSCVCKLNPDLTYVPVKAEPDDDNVNCYQEGSKISGHVFVGASSGPINGGQFAMTYDPTCVKLNSITNVAPYTRTVYGPLINEAAGTIFVSVGVEPGAGDGPAGNANMLLISFIKIGDCNECSVCFTDSNPQHTLLVDGDGQPVIPAPECSKILRDLSELTLTTPDNLTDNVDCDSQTSTQSWDEPSVTDTCNDAQVICRGHHRTPGGNVPHDQGTILGGGDLEIGVHEFCCYAEQPDGEWCDQSIGCSPEDAVPGGCVRDPSDNNKPVGCWTVTISDEVSLDVDIQLSPSTDSKPGDGLTRCIKFTLYPNCIQDPTTFYEDVSFGGDGQFVGKFEGKIKIPGDAKWDCITAQDQFHTLRSCYVFDENGDDCVDGQLSAKFQGDPRFNLNGSWLVGGNLDAWKKNETPLPEGLSLDVIDIIDYGQFVAEYLATYDSEPNGTPDGNSPCGTEGPHADISDDGTVDMDDFTYISMNYLASSKQCCCGPEVPGDAQLGRTEVSVRELRQLGLGDLAVADLNGDGVLNGEDMNLFMQGARPEVKKAQPDRKGSGLRSGSR